MAFSGFPVNRPFDFNFQVAAPDGIARSSTELCRECASLDLEAAFHRAHSMYEEARRGNNTRTLASFSTKQPNGVIYLRDFYFVTSLGKRLSENRICKLCSFLKKHAQDPIHGTYKLLIISSSETNLFEPPRKSARGHTVRRPWDDMEDNVFLAVVPEVVGIPKTGIPLRWLELELPRTGCIYRLTKELEEEDGKRLVLPVDIGPRVEKDLIDWWKETCVGFHRSHCAPKKPPGATLRGFRAINCLKDPPVVEEISWREEYVALSYVWGTGTEKWPQTVKDAVQVTKMTGQKYLWVDRLCIDQSNVDEKMYLISKMDAIYEGAEFTIVNAAGDARTGLPGTRDTPRQAQPQVQLDLAAAGSSRRLHETSKDIYSRLVNVPEAEYEQEVTGHTRWLDTYRHGLQNTMAIDLSEFTQKEERTRRYGISREHLDFFEDTAAHFGTPFDEFMEKQKELARRMGIQLHEVVPHLIRKAAEDAGQPIADGQPLPALVPPEAMPITDSKKAKRPLPPTNVSGKLVLLSTMQDPRVTIRESQWATRGWTYQEGVLSRRCLVFTPEQVYWECRGMAVNESINLPFPALHEDVENNGNLFFADYMLSGIFRGDMHRAPELQYGFQEDKKTDDVPAQLKTLDSHIRSFSSRKLTNSNDSWNAFLGVAARYTAKEEGLSMLLGIPFWAGKFADGSASLQHSFAMSMSVWFHVGRMTERDSRLYISERLRRAKFPSWSWIGWEGKVEFNGDERNDEDDEEDFDDDIPRDNAHLDFFMAMTSPSWVRSVTHIWSAEMVLHSEDRYASTLLYGNVSLKNFVVDPGRRWLLTLKSPLVLRHLYLMESKKSWEWRRLMGKVVELHMSLLFTEQELVEGHKRGDMATVLIHAGTVPYVWDGRARFLVLRKVKSDGTQWERVGRLTLILEEWRMDKYATPQDMISDLPVKRFGGDITLI